MNAVFVHIGENMENIKSEISFVVYSDEYYQHWVSYRDHEYSISYHEGEKKKQIFFASVDEMEAVANAMLDLVGLLKKKGT